MPTVNSNFFVKRFYGKVSVYLTFLVLFVFMQQDSIMLADEQWSWLITQEATSQQQTTTDQQNVDTQQTNNTGALQPTPADQVIASWLNIMTSGTDFSWELSWQSQWVQSGTQTQDTTPAPILELDTTTTTEIWEMHIEDVAVDALLTKDINQDIREIQLEETGVVVWSNGVTVIIPEDTRIFAPTVLADNPVLPAVASQSETILPEPEAAQSIVTPIVESTSPTTPTPEAAPSPTSSSVQILNTELMVAQEQIPVPILDAAAPTGTDMAEAFGWRDPLLSSALVVEDIVAVDPVDTAAITDTTATAQSTLDNTELTKTFAFGITNQHIVFTKPVEIQVVFPGVADETQVSLRVKHEWDDIFGSQWLSNDPNATCDELWNISLPADTAVVYGEMAIFYTCGASEFAIGVINPTFNGNSNSTINALVVQPDGMVVVWWLFTTMWWVSRLRIARVTSTGAIDTTFSWSARSAINAIALETGGDIIIGWTFTGVRSSTINRIARLTSTGWLDTWFTWNVNNTVSAVAVDSGGNVLLAWSFTTVSGVARNRFARVRAATGGIDSNFNPNVNSTISAMAIQDDSKIIIGWAFTTVGGFTISRIARVTTTGALDRWFTGVVNSTISALAIQADGKIIIGGAFTTVNGIARNRLARLSTTGMIDESFNPNVNNTVSALAIQSDGSIIIGGSFTAIGGLSGNRIARILGDGSLDTTFNPDANNTVLAMGLDAGHESVYIGWTFTTVGGVSRNRFARIWLVPSTCAGMTGCAIRLKADAGVTQSGAGVAARRSQGEHDLTGVQATWSWQPLYLTSAMNYNPTLRFDGVDDGLTVNTRGVFYDNDSSQYVVFRTLDLTGTMTTLATTTWFSATVCGRAFNLTGGKFTTVLAGERLTSDTSVNDNKARLASWSYGTGAPQTIAVDTNVERTGAAWRSTVNTEINMLIGRATVACASWWVLSGEIAEILTFHRNLSAWQELEVESYLALKYGITLSQVSPVNYAFPGDLIVRDATGAWAFTSDIAGIGRDTTTSLNQLKSQSANDTGDIIVEYTGSLNDDEFLVRGNDAQDMTARSAIDAPIGYERITRERKFEENYGAIWSVIVRIASGSIPIPITGTAIMLVDSDGTMANATPYIGQLSGEDRVFFADIADGEYLTFWTQSITELWSLTIESPLSLWYAWVDTSLDVQVIEQYFSGADMYFKVSDYIGSATGYVTTMQLSGNLTTGAYSISSTNVSFKSGSGNVTLLSGTANTGVLIDTNATSYQSLNTARTFIYRNNGQGGIVGTYGDKIRLQTTIPAGQPWGSYVWTLVYTLIEN